MRGTAINGKRNSRVLNGMPASLVLYFDGLCEPKNPGGVATYGYAIYRGAKKLCEGFGTVGAGLFGDDVSNNVAEYTAMIKGMERLLASGYTGPINVRGDSQLIIRQMQGRYAVRAKRLAALHEKAKAPCCEFRTRRLRVDTKRTERGGGLPQQEGARGISFRAPRGVPLVLRSATMTPHAP